MFIQFFRRHTRAGTRRATLGIPFWCAAGALVVASTIAARAHDEGTSAGSSAGIWTAASMHGLSVMNGQGAAASTGGDKDEEELARVGEETTDQVCTPCHPWEEFVHLRRSVRDWDYMVTSMAARGARATDAQLTIVKKFLTRYYGVVAINTATAAELTAVLGLTPAEAAAVVKHRTAHGRFPNVAALAKVPGVDAAKLEADPEALRFE